MKIKVDYMLDAKGLACPMPIVKTKNKIKELSPGEVLEIQATDKGSEADLKAWAKSNGEEYLGTIKGDGVLKHYVRKSREEETNEPTTYERVVSLEDVQEKLNDEMVTILDVREPAEYAFKHVSGAISIPFGELETRINELNKNNDIFVICRTGNRSDYAAQMLIEKGFKKVANVLPGMISWNGPSKTLNGGNKS